MPSNAPSPPSLSPSQPPKIRHTIPDLYRSVDYSGRIIDCNEAYAKALGYTIDEIIGVSIFDHAPKSNYVAMKNSFETWKGTGTVSNRKIRMLRKNGTEFDVLLSATNRFDENNNLIGSDTTLLDISELEDLQKLVMNKKYESLYENSPDLYRTVNAKGIIIDCNNAYAQKLGYTKDEVIGTDLLEHTATKSISVMKINMANWRQTSDTQTIQIWMKRKDGNTFPASLTPTNLYDDDGFLIGRNVVIQDQSELQKTKNVLSDLEKVDQLKEEFSSMITHELKSPLTPIFGYCEMLLQPEMYDLGEEEVQIIKEIQRNATKLNLLISDILDAQKLDMGKMVFNKVIVNADQFLKDLYNDLIPLAREKEIQLVVKQFPSVVILCDPNRLSQVMMNLLQNAIDFVPKKIGKIEFGATIVNDYNIEFFVQDNGIGIPKSKQENLFKKFYQVDTTLSRKHGGTGLGLVICKGIVENMGGTIGLESDEGQGARFFFRFPIN